MLVKNYYQLGRVKSFGKISSHALRKRLDSDNATPLNIPHLQFSNLKPCNSDLILN